jgi:hypothetical protein
MKSIVFAAALSILLAGCQSLPGQHDWHRSEVYFGLSRPDGSLIAQAEWQTFVDEVVTPAFPAGLSVLEAVGQWRGNDGRVVRESSRMLILLHAPGADTSAAIDRIRAEYVRRFKQDAVMKVTTWVKVAF